MTDNTGTQEKEQDTEEKDPIQHRLLLRNLLETDYPDVKEIMDLVYPRMHGAWHKSVYLSLLKTFPEGQICIEDNGKVVGAALSLIVDYNRYGDRHTYDQITGNGNLDTHDGEGDTLYGVDIFVHPEYRNLRLGRRLYDARKQLCEELNLRRIIAGGRIPGYHKVAGELKVQEYLTKVRQGEIWDPVLSFQLANDFHVRKVLTNYIPEDVESRSYATLLEWINIYYEPEGKSLLSARKSVVRAGAVQWQMRRVHGVQDILDQAEYFVDAIAGYNADFILFPEFFNGPLMGKSNDKSPSAAIRHLAEYTDEIRAAMVDLALAYNINIIAGSMPEVGEEEHVYNVSYLCRRDGTYDSQRKLHITPDERSYWGITGGQDLRVFETDVGKVGILICYDVEFPEVPRLLAEQGMKILFVPFWTDTKSGYLRVRRCAQARAIENECYVVITGSVGNLPKVENMDIQYSQAAMFSPADFAFPHDAVISEATPNTEMTLVSDLDLDLLKDLRYQGSVRNFKDRRRDLYRISWLNDDSRPGE